MRKYESYIRYNNTGRRLFLCYDGKTYLFAWRRNNPFKYLDSEFNADDILKDRHKLKHVDTIII